MVKQRPYICSYSTRGRCTRPVTPIIDRKCCYCNNNSIDDEKHFILLCDTFQLKKQCFVNRVRALFPQFDNMTIDEKLRLILCPPTVDWQNVCQGIMTDIRKEIDMVLNPMNFNIYLKHVAT